MLSKTTRLHKPTHQFLTEECDNQAAYLESLKEKVEAVLEELLNDKKTVESRYSEERRTLIEQLEAKDGLISKLEVKVRQLQKENQQIRYQYEQRVTLMNILKQQNWLISKQYSQEKDRLQSTIEYLTRESQSLKETIIKNTQPLPLPYPYKTFNSPKKPPQFAKQPQFFSMTDLKPNFSHKKAGNRFIQSNHSQVEGSMDNSISRSSIREALILNKMESQFKQSRITQAKPTGKWKQCGLQRMSAITYLSREDD